LWRHSKCQVAKPKVSNLRLRLTRELCCVVVAYEQSIFRTMVFKRLQTDFIEIDGIKYEVTNSANQDHFDCKEKFLNIIFCIETGFDEDYLTPDTLPGWKKELISKLKEFEKKYVKHAKTTNPQLAKIHLESMTPVVELMESSFNLMNFYKLAKAKNYPDFRKKAVTEKFVEHLEKVCLIIKGFPNKDQKTLDYEYDVAHIIELLQIENWQECPPFKFYLDPLQKAFNELAAVLKEMRRLGPLRNSYYVERNYEMTNKIFELMRQYNIVKILIGDELKRD